MSCIKPFYFVWATFVLKSLQQNWWPCQDLCSEEDEFWLWEPTDAGINPKRNQTKHQHVVNNGWSQGIPRQEKENLIRRRAQKRRSMWLLKSSPRKKRNLEKKSVKECWMSKSKFVKFVKFENSVKGALGDCEKPAGLGAKFLWEISKSHSISRDYGQGRGNWRHRVCNA